MRVVRISNFRRKQPEGLQESSRWSERSEDHRKRSKLDSPPGGVQDIKALCKD